MYLEDISWLKTGFHAVIYCFTLRSFYGGGPIVNVVLIYELTFFCHCHIFLNPVLIESAEILQQVNKKITKTRYL